MKRRELVLLLCVLGGAEQQPPGADPDGRPGERAAVADDHLADLGTERERARGLDHRRRHDRRQRVAHRMDHRPRRT
jgi:hypothetical protein